MFSKYLCLLPLVLTLNSFPILAEKSTTAELRFEVPVPGPAMVEHCAGFLWIYSVEKAELWKLNPKNGDILTRVSVSQIGISGKVSALGCKDGTLLAASFQESPFQVFFYQFPILSDPSAMLLSAKIHRLPGQPFVRDIFCGPQLCYLIRKKIYSSRDLETWSEVAVAHSGDIEQPAPQMKDSPFKYWQDSFIVAKGDYFRGIALTDENLLLLDSIRGSVVTHGPKDSTKWEAWGFREGNILFPKSFVLLKDDTLVISDVGLKLLFVFDRQGRYWGSIGSDGKSDRFGYPLDIAAIDNTVYVADFFKNELLAFEINIIEKAEPPEKEKTPIQRSFFRHPSVMENFSETRCLNCHDGLETYNLERFLKKENVKHHPFVECFSCHQPHHEAPGGIVVSQHGDVKAVKRLPFQLRQSIPDLCLNCHQEKGSRDENHFHIKREKLKVKAKQVIACSQCHKMHQSEGKLLKKEVVNLCMTCHSSSQVPQSHPLRPEVEGVTCISCHSIHASTKALHFARLSHKEGEEVCLACHKDRKPRIGHVEHLKIDLKIDCKDWPGVEVVCLRCHHPHEKKPRTTSLCVSCHRDRLEKHHAKNLLPLLKRAGMPVPEGIILEEGKLSCATCHDPHDIANQEHYLRPRQEAIKKTCTAFCHESAGMDQRFKEYHQRQKIRKGSHK